MAKKRIYLVNDQSGGYAWGNSEAMAKALEKVGYRRVSLEEYQGMRRKAYREELKAGRIS